MKRPADKRRCVEIALREFPKLSPNQIADLCGVAKNTVVAVRQESGCQIDKVIGSDGKQYPAHRPVNLGNSQVEKRIGLDGKERPAHRDPAPSREQEHDGEVA